MATATAADIVSLDGQAHEILKRVGNGSLGVADVRRGFQLIIEKRLGEPSAADGAVNRFISATAPVPNLWSWNRKFGWGFTQEQVIAAAAAAPVPAFVGDRPLVALTLCWTLGTLEDTLNAKLAIMRRVYGEDKVFVSASFKTDAVHASFVDGAPAFVPNRLWWQVIDVGANRRRSPDQVLADTAASTEVFDVACQHPAYVKQHNGFDIPYLCVPGLRIEVPGKSWPYAPFIHGGSNGYVEVGVRWADETDSHYAGPVRL